MRTNGLVVLVEEERGRGGGITCSTWWIASSSSPPAPCASYMPIARSSRCRAPSLRPSAPAACCATIFLAIHAASGTHLGGNREQHAAHEAHVHAEAALPQAGAGAALGQPGGAPLQRAKRSAPLA